MKYITTLALIVLTYIFVAEAANAQATTFFDDFNRSDGPVGNGWSNFPNQPYNLVIRNDKLTVPIGYYYSTSGIYRPIEYIGPVTVSATITQQSGCCGTYDQFHTGFIFHNDGTDGIGYGLYFTRSDNNANNSTVILVKNGTTLQILNSTFQFDSQISVNFTVDPDGSILGSVTDSAYTFNFQFPAVDLSGLSGTNFAITQAGPDNRNSTFIYPTIDDVSIEYTPSLLSFFPLLDPSTGMDYTPEKAPIHSVFDHSMTISPVFGTLGLYECDGVVVAFTGDVGIADATPGGAGLVRACRQPGYNNANRQPFSLGQVDYISAGSDTNADFRLNYDGHPGYDYKAQTGTSVFAAASGTIFYPLEMVGLLGSLNNAYCNFHVLAIAPDSTPGYRIYYLHLSTHPNQINCPGSPIGASISFDQTNGSTIAPDGRNCYTQDNKPYSPSQLPLPAGLHVEAGCLVALSGWAGLSGQKDAHLHFEVQKVIADDDVSPHAESPLPACFQDGHAPFDKVDYSKEDRSLSGYKCVPVDPYGWTCPTGSSKCPDGDPYQIMTGVASKRLWVQH